MTVEQKAGFIALSIGGLYMLYKGTQHKYKYFTRAEFADHYSGANEIKPALIEKLDIAREIAGIPFIINSGYRDKNNPESIKNPTSSHIKGLAADIRTTPDTYETIKDALIKAGFVRLGLGNGFIHADIDIHKTQNVVWFYDGRNPVYNYRFA